VPAVQSSPLTVQLTLSGRPLSRREVRFPALDAALSTDERGRLEVTLDYGRHMGTVEAGGEHVPFELVNAIGLRVVRVDLRLDERPLDDPTAVAAMPSERYVPLSLLGTGSAGLVYRCRDTALDRLVALKILHEDFAGVAENNEMVVTEARRLAQVDSPHLIDIYDVGLHGGAAYIVFEYVEGPNLEQLRLGEQVLGSAAIAAAGVHLAQALLAIHEAGLLHRDVKPSNGLVDRRGVVKLADFGLARSMLDLASPQSRVFGTPPFMSPEQLQGQPLGPSSDVYSLGATLFDLATGHPPFHEGDLLLAALFDAPPDLLVERPDCPEKLASLVAKMLAKDPSHRPDATDVIDALMLLAAETTDDEAQPYLPRLSGSALGLRWLAGPATRRADAYRSGELLGLEEPDTLVEGSQGTGKAADGVAAEPSGGALEGPWEELAETQVLASPSPGSSRPLFDPQEAPRPETGPLAVPGEFGTDHLRAQRAASRRSEWMSFVMGLLIGLAATATLLAILY
jgi:serine/threonine protein kinase